MTRLTKRAVDAERPGPKDRIVWDSEIRGFGLKVTPAGRKVYILQYRMGGRGFPTKRYKIGYHGDITADEARQRAEKLRGQISDGIDPAEAKRAERETAKAAADRRFADIALDFVLRYHVGLSKPSDLARFPTLQAARENAAELESLVGEPRNRSWREISRVLLKDVFPVWGERDIASIKRADVARLLASIAENNGPVQSVRTLSVIRKMFNWCLLQPKLMDVLEANPIVPGMAPGKAGERDRFLSAEEIPLVWAAAEAQGYPYGTAAKLMLVTGQRRTEVARMRRADIDRERRVWTLPKENVKRKRRHEVMLSDLALEIIDTIPDRGELMLTTTGKGPITGWTWAKSSLDEHAAAAAAELGVDPPAPWTYHDLRRTMATYMEDQLSIPRRVVSAVLNHAESGITKIYTRGELREAKQAAMDAWSRYLLTLLGRGDGSNVVPLRSA